MLFIILYNLLRTISCVDQCSDPDPLHVMMSDDWNLNDAGRWAPAGPQQLQEQLLHRGGHQLEPLQGSRRQRPLQKVVKKDKPISFPEMEFF